MKRLLVISIIFIVVYKVILPYLAFPFTSILLETSFYTEGIVLLTIYYTLYLYLRKYRSVEIEKWVPAMWLTALGLRTLMGFLYNLLPDFMYSLADGRALGTIIYALNALMSVPLIFLSLKLIKKQALPPFQPLLKLQGFLFILRAAFLLLPISRLWYSLLCCERIIMNTLFTIEKFISIAPELLMLVLFIIELVQRPVVKNEIKPQ